MGARPDGPSRLGCCVAAEIAFGQTCKDLGRFVLPTAGTYTAEVYTDGTATGPYTFTVRPNQ